MPETIAPICVWPDARVRAWPGEGAVAYDCVDAERALCGRWETDAHAAAYLTPDVDSETGWTTRQPRLRLGATAVLPVAPALAWAMLDVDRAGHAPWPSPASARVALEALLDVGAGPLFSRAGIYVTRAGLRLVWRLGRPVDVTRADGWLRGLRRAVEREAAAAGVPLAVDPSTCQWTRCFRLPRVRRDGVDLDLALDVSRCLRMTLDPSSVEADLAVRREALPVDVDHTPPDGEPPPEAVVAALSRLPPGLAARAREGRPLATRGSRDATLWRCVSELTRGARGVPDVDLSAAVHALLLPSVHADITDGAPTDDELWSKCRRAAELEVGRREALRALGDQPVVVYTAGSSYYVLDAHDGGYVGPVPPSAMCEALERHGPPGVDTRTGTGRPRTTAEYVADFGRRAERVLAVMGTARTAWSPDDGGTLLEAACAPRAVTPRAHADVGHWLAALGGERAGRLLDWLATAPLLDRPTCALYLHGPRASGKGLFAAGLASLWPGGWVPFESAVGRFNDALLRNPVVFLDESAPDGTFSSSFRRLVAESERAVERKFCPATVLRGCPRLVIAANNADALRIRERLTAEDVAAVAERVLYVPIDGAAAETLHALGGRTGTAEWVLRADGSPGLVAEHVAWLAETRAVVSGSRLLVEGEEEDWHRDLALWTGLVPTLLAAVATAVLRGLHAHAWEVREGDVLVHLPLFRDGWAALTRTPAPDDVAIARAVAVVSGSGKHLDSRGRCAALIPAAALRRVAEGLHLARPDELDAALARTPAAQLGPNAAPVPF